MEYIYYLCHLKINGYNYKQKRIQINVANPCILPCNFFFHPTKNSNVFVLLSSSVNFFVKDPALIVKPGLNFKNMISF